MLYSEKQLLPFSQLLFLCAGQEGGRRISGKMASRFIWEALTMRSKQRLPTTLLLSNSGHMKLIPTSTSATMHRSLPTLTRYGYSHPHTQPTIHFFTTRYYKLCRLSGSNDYKFGCTLTVPSCAPHSRLRLLCNSIHLLSASCQSNMLNRPDIACTCAGDRGGSGPEPAQAKQRRSEDQQPVQGSD